MDKKNWKVDYEMKIIYMKQNILDMDIVAFVNEISTNEKGLLAGPGVTWKIVVTGDN